jgi:hypothetical protein
VAVPALGSSRTNLLPRSDGHAHFLVTQEPGTWLLICTFDSWICDWWTRWLSSVCVCVWSSVQVARRCAFFVVIWRRAEWTAYIKVFIGKFSWVENKKSSRKVCHVFMKCEVISHCCVVLLMESFLKQSIAIGCYCLLCTGYVIIYLVLTYICPVHYSIVTHTITCTQHSIM